MSEMKRLLRRVETCEQAMDGLLRILERALGEVRHRLVILERRGHEQGDVSEDTTGG